MTQSVARRVASGGAGVLIAALTVVGLSTASVMHIQRTRSLDEALLAAVHGRAHPESDVEIEVEHSRSPVETWLVEPHDTRLPSDLGRRAQQTDRPQFATVGNTRMVVLAFEVEGKHEVEGVAAAAAPTIQIGQSVGPFLAIYSVFAAIVALLGMLAQLAIVRRAFEPLDRARRQAGRVVGFGRDQRLSDDAPKEIAPLLTAINDLLERLETAHQVQTRFAAEAAHELRTPVTSLMGELDVALRAPRSNEDYETLLRSLREDVQRLRLLVDGLTALTRVDIGELGGERELMHAGEVAANALATEFQTLKAAGISVDLLVDDDPEILVHRTLLETALANLLRNAARHAAGAPVTLRVTKSGDRVEFTVDDGGPGIPASDLESVFGRFVRGARSREYDRSGLGLGLSLSRDVARRHGGDCVLGESPAGGLRARLSVAVSETPD